MAYNSQNSTVRRLENEYRALVLKPESNFVAGPSGDNLFEWHFSIKGPRESPFEGGVYHGKIVFPTNYPLSPPDIYFFTPNGRFETNTKICLNTTSYHADTWSPAWGVSIILTSIIPFFETKAMGAIGGLDYSDQQRRQLAIKSRSYKCPVCSLHIEPDPLPTDTINIANESEEIEELQHSHTEENIEIEHKPTETVEEQHLEAPVIAEEEEKLVQIRLTAYSSDEARTESPRLEETVSEPNVDEDSFIDEEEAVKEEDLKPRYNYATMNAKQGSEPTSFYPIYDIPILTLFLILLFLIFNSVFGFVRIFE